MADSGAGRRALLILLALLCASPSCARQGVSISYSPAFDAICSAVRGVNIDRQWKAELEDVVPQYRKLWNDVGPELMHAAEQLTGLHSTTSETVHLTLCDVPSQSMLGVSVNMRYALSTFTAEPVPLRYKVDTLFHELLHRRLRGHVPATSRLLNDHPDESECVRNHLHLLALQKAVLLQTGEGEALATVIATDGELPSGCYRRAWEFVNATEGAYLAYVDELRASAHARH